MPNGFELISEITDIETLFARKYASCIFSKNDMEKSDGESLKVM